MACNMKEPAPNGFVIPKVFLANDPAFKRSSAGAVGGRTRAGNMADELKKSFLLHIKDNSKAKRK